MKRILLSFLLSAASFIFCYSATVKWDGEGGDGLWATAANWVGDIAPIAGDDVILDNSVVTATYIVNLPAGVVDVSISSLTITPSGTNNITLILPLANTSGTAFRATGTGDAVILNDRAIFINSSGATGTPVSVTSTNFFRINNGGRYIHNTRAGHTDYLVSRLSTVTGTEHGIFEFDMPTASSTITLSGRTYGTLILSSTANGGTKTYSGNGASPLNINGDLIINSGVTFSIGLSANMTVHGKYDQAASSTFNMQNSTNNNLVRLQGDVNAAGIITESNSGFPVLELNGSSNQVVSISGSITNSVNFRMNNSAGATLSSPVSLPFNLDLQNGKIKTTGFYLLTLTDDATVTGGSVTSFVEGPMKKIGDDNFTFPVGKGSIYAPIGFVSSGMSVMDAFQAEYFRLNPQTAYGINYQSPPIHHISYVEYWRLDKVAGSTSIPAKINLAVTEYSFAKDLATLYVARYNSADVQWKNNDIDSKIPGPVVTPYVTGTITSAPVSPFGVFTIATSESEVINPLPVNLISFNATRINDTEAKIQWLLADYYPGSVKFEVERSVNGREFSGIKALAGSSSGYLYTVVDDQVQSRIIRYRLKITNEDGKITYSNTVFLSCTEKNIELGLYPNPASDKTVINIYSSSVRNFTIMVCDATGKTIKKWQQLVSAGNTRMPYQTSELSKGIYFIHVNTENFHETLRFVKL